MSKEKFVFHFGNGDSDKDLVDEVVSEALDAPEFLPVPVEEKADVEKGEEDVVESPFLQSPSNVASSSSSNIVPVQQSMSMSDGLGAIFGKGKVTTDQNVHELGVADENLGMKTEIRDVAGVSIWELVGQRALDKGYPKTAAVYEKFTRFFKVNSVSRGREGRKEMTRILTARRQDELESPELQGREKLLGSRGNR